MVAGQNGQVGHCVIWVNVANKASVEIDFATILNHKLEESSVWVMILRRYHVDMDNLDHVIKVRFSLFLFVFLINFLQVT